MVNLKKWSMKNARTRPILGMRTGAREISDRNEFKFERFHDRVLDHRHCHGLCPFHDHDLFPFAEIVAGLNRLETLLK